MKIALVSLLIVAAGCSSSTRNAEEVEEPAKAPPPGSSKLAIIPIDEAGNRYVIDPTTRSCFLVIQDAEGPLAPARVSCVRLRENLPEAAEHVTWVSEAPEERQLPGKPHDPEALAIIEGIRQVNDTTWEIEGEALNGALANPREVARGARLVPSMKEGKPNGFKIYAIRRSSIFAALGFKNGDTLKKANGIELSPPDKALEAYTRVRDAEEVVIDLERRGEARRHTYRIIR